MGLDCYLERMPRYGNTTPHEISAIESYFDWKENPEGKKYTMKEWCGIPFKDVPKGKTMEFYKEYCKYGYAPWDTEQKYTGRYRIIEEIGYWRKANEIHNWFVEHVQDGVDDCCYHEEVTKEVLEELLAICQKVLANCELVEGKITNGYTFDANGNKVYNFVDGKYVKDPSTAMELLPTTSGFFFGNTEYDEYYVQDIEDTIEICKKALETTDFETQMIFYVSSW